jgi:hypothetical protein
MLRVLAPTTSRHQPVFSATPQVFNAHSAPTSASNTIDAQHPRLSTSLATQPHRPSTTVVIPPQQRVSNKRSAAALQSPTPRIVGQHQQLPAVHELTLSSRSASNRQQLAAGFGLLHIVSSTSRSRLAPSTRSESVRDSESRLRAAGSCLLLPCPQLHSESLQRQRSFVACVLGFRASCVHGSRAL